ncbi:MAG TPA: hypothetical protein VF056_04215 [Thermoleophilaceae bacterium]
MSRKLVLVAAFALMLAIPSTVSAGHGLKAWLEAYYDHPMPAFAPTAPPSPVFSSGGPGAQWELVGSIPTGNPHTDIDYFTQGGETFASVGTLAIGPNGGGQTIVQLTKDGAVTPSSPKFVAGHPSATCPSNPSAALGLQHDIEATPKGNAILNATNTRAVEERRSAVDRRDRPARPLPRLQRVRPGDAAARRPRAGGHHRHREAQGDRGSRATAANRTP